MARNNLIRDLLVVILAALVLGLPFIGQAFHIDDTNFLYIAKQILKEPLRPYSFDINWRGTEEHAFDILANPPLCPYYSALVIRIFGESEPLLHAAYMLFAVLAGLFMYFFAKRFTRRPLICALLFISTPAFMVMSHTVMPDIALTAFYLGAVTFFIWGLEESKRGLLILSGIFMGLASLARYSGLTVFFVVVMYAFLSQKRLTSKAMPALIIGAVIFLVWCTHNLIFYKKLHFLQASGFQLVTLTAEDILCKLGALLIYIGSTTVFVLFLVLGFLKKLYKKVFFILLAAGLHFGIIVKMRFGAMFSQLILLVMVMTAVLFFFFVMIDGIAALEDKEKRARIFLVGWIVFLLAFSSFTYFVAVKHILLFLAALIVLFVKMMGDFQRRFQTLYLAMAFLSTAALGFGVSYADFKYADVYRDFANNVAPRYKTANNNIWYVGHWGFQYYMDRLGFKALSWTDDSPKEDDILIIPSLIAEHQWPCEKLQKRLRLTQIIQYPLSFPVRTMNARLKFSFYTNNMLLYNPGFLPYFFTRQDLEDFAVYKVGR